MAIDFPSSPANNDVYTYGNQSWYWANNYGSWLSNSGISMTLSDTSPSVPSSGDMWWNSSTGGLYIYYNDGSSSQWVEAAPRIPTVSSPFGYSIIFGGF